MASRDPPPAVRAAPPSSSGYQTPNSVTGVFVRLLLALTGVARSGGDVLGFRFFLDPEVVCDLLVRLDLDLRLKLEPENRNKNDINY